MAQVHFEKQLDLFDNNDNQSNLDNNDLSQLSISELAQTLALQESHRIYKIVEKIINSTDILEKSNLSQNLQKVLFDKCLESQRWNSFKSSYQMKLVGWSGIDENTKAPKGFSHVHLEAWTCYPEATISDNLQVNNKVITAFADNATYCNIFQPSYFNKKNKT